MSERQLEDSRLSLGLGLLRLESLDWDTAEVNTSTVDEPKEPQKTIETPPPPEPSIEQDEEDLSDSDSNALNDPNAEGLNLPKAPDSSLSSSIEPEQAAEESNSADLDDEVTENNIIPSSNSEGHDEQTQTSGSEESDPEQEP